MKSARTLMPICRLLTAVTRSPRRAHSRALFCMSSRAITGPRRQAAYRASINHHFREPRCKDKLERFLCFCCCFRAVDGV